MSLVRAIAVAVQLSFSLSLVGQTASDLKIESALKVSFTTDLFKDYQVQSSPDLVTWHNDGPPILGAANTITRFYDNPSSRIFYRLSITEHPAPRQWDVPYGGDFENGSTIALAGPGIDRIAILPIDLTTKYVVTGEVKVNGYAGFVIGYNPSLKRYASVYSGNGGTEIWTYVEQARTYSTTLNHTWSNGTWIPFQIERDGSQYRIRINSVDIIYELNGSGYGNYFGLLAQFDNKVEIRSFQYAINGVPGPPPPPTTSRLVILEAIYRANGIGNNVSDILRSSIVNDSISLSVNNESMGGDPAFGFRKELHVRYTFDGVEFSKTISEGGTLTLP